MRRLIITRGPQGAGKSYALRQLGLDGCMISGDLIRQILGGPTLREDGTFTAYHDQEPRVWAMLHDLLQERMARGELIAIDATHRRRRDFRKYLILAARYRYEVACLDLSTVPLELALAQNQQRPPWAVVPEDILRETWAACEAGEVPEGVHHVRWSEDGAHLEAMRQWLSVPVVDLSGYRRVHHVGDLQGCLAPLRAYYDARGGLRDDEAHVFVGDLCDRGPENAEVVRFIRDHCLRDGQRRPNVFLLWGNHEDHLDRWAHEEASTSEEFDRTAAQFEAAGVSRAEIKALCDQMQACLLYRWGEQRVMVTHAGLSTVPERPERVSLRQYGRGSGKYGCPVDQQFSDQAPAGWVQIHGHRNPGERPVQAAPRSYNLEGAVEHGGHLRCLTLDGDGFTPVETPNSTFIPLEARMAQGATIHNKKLIPQWVRPGERPHLGFDAEGLAALRDHDLIAERPSPTLPHLSSFNFTRDAFMDRRWDALNLTARGLFVDTESGEIVARAYDKFFNLRERPETQPKALEASLRFPVEAYLKENGFLGILGYDPKSDQLLWATKSSIEQDFALRFKALFEALVPARHHDFIRRYLRDTASSMTFEVVDPGWDPHIIEYAGPRLILLDVIRRAPRFERVPYEALKGVGRKLEIEVKRPAGRFKDWASLWAWVQQVEDPAYTFEGHPVEGFVLEDAAGFQTKLKLGYYSFWKRMRGLKNRVLKIRGTGKSLDRDLSDPTAAAFCAWCERQSDEALGLDIIALRKAFLSGAEAAIGPDGPVALGLGPTAPPPPPRRELAGFQRALDGLAAGDKPIKAETAAALLARAEADPELMEILKAHPIYPQIIASGGDA